LLTLPAAEENQTTWPERWWRSTEPTGLQPGHNVDGHTPEPLGELAAEACSAPETA